MSETYADAPVSLGTKRAVKAWNGQKWTPREALVDTLRRIDRGEIDPSDVVVCLGERSPDGWRTSFASAGSGGSLVAHGLLARVSSMIDRDGER